ncbi:hypothetical protein MAR_032079 [Mya arenaria]|uniref:PHD-type domain-containing protein n=1 Tax=Mya arenaria TaxID=6604 RepID=A0ABY7F6F2_MYAAR|nr:hypothetical protein MAR_032079 [Mya arenaria]
MKKKEEDSDFKENYKSNNLRKPCDSDKSNSRKQNVCDECEKSYASVSGTRGHMESRSHAIQCDVCERWQHRKCNTGVSHAQYRKLQKLEITIEWSCEDCKMTEMDTIVAAAVGSLSTISDIAAYN